VFIIIAILSLVKIKTFIINQAAAAENLSAAALFVV
jgi:hypothetical protein